MHAVCVVGVCALVQPIAGRKAVPTRRPAWLSAEIRIRRLSDIAGAVGARRIGRRSVWWLATVPATTFALGTWQLYRLQWKKGILDDAERSIAEPPIDLNSVWKSGYAGKTLSRAREATRGARAWEEGQ